MNSHPETADIAPTPAGHSGRQRIGDLLGKGIFAALLGLLILAAIAYGGSDPLWKAFLACVIFAIGVVAALEVVLSGNATVPEFRILLPGVALVLFSVLQSVQLSQSDGAAFGIRYRFWNSISFDPYETRIFALQLLALIILTALFFRYTDGDRRLRRLIHTIIAIAVVSALFGLLRQTMQHQPGFLLPLLQPERGYGQFINKNHFAYLMEIGLGLALGLVVAGGVRRERALIYLAVLLPIWTALVLTNSRGGILAMLVQLVVTVLLLPIALRDRSPRRALFTSTVARLAFVASLIVLVTVGVLWVGGDRLVSNFEATRGEFAESTESRENVTRVRIWQATMQIIRAHPVAGVGMGAYWTAVPAYHEASGTMTPQQAHNDYLELLASGGLVGLAIFVWFVIVVLKNARANLRAPERSRRAACFAALIAMAGVAVHSLVDFGLHRMLNAMLFAALIVIATRNATSEPNPQKENA